MIFRIAYPGNPTWSAALRRYRLRCLEKRRNARRRLQHDQTNRTALQRKGQSSRRHRLSGVCLAGIDSSSMQDLGPQLPLEIAQWHRLRGGVNKTRPASARYVGKMSVRDTDCRWAVSYWPNRVPRTLLGAVTAFGHRDQNNIRISLRSVRYHRVRPAWVAIK